MPDMADYMRNRREERRTLLVNLAGGCCIKCGRPAAFNFDHRDPTTKLFTLSGDNLDKPMDVIMAEYAKCDLLCEECHIEKTVENGENRRNHSPAAPFLHGTARMYLEQGCRCNSCRQARKEHRNGSRQYNQVL